MQTGDLRRATRRMGGLPPGQRRVEGFPRFGTHLHRPPPPTPLDPVIEIAGPALRECPSVPVSLLGDLPRRELVADFHCVAGWSATDLHWEGVEFADFYKELIGPHLAPGAAVSHLVWRGRDGFESVMDVRDAFEGVLIADRLNGAPLDPEHGAPVRVVSPEQYGFMSIKHLCRVAVCTSVPSVRNPAAIRIGPFRFRTALIEPHPRARVWLEERHPSIPARWLRPLYRLLVPPIAALSAKRHGPTSHISAPDGPRRTAV